MVDLAPHVMTARVYYEDTDAAGIVYYANYLRFAERGRTEMMRAMGYDHIRLFNETGIALAVKRCAVEYVAPARLDDLIEIESKITGTRAATIDASQVIRRDGRELARIAITLVAMTKDGRPVRLPAPLRALLPEFDVN